MEVNSINWKLPEELIALSEGDTWPKVLEEWEPGEIVKLEPGEDSETCLCHHHPIREVCYIYNHENEKEAIVGNCCIKRFERDTAFAGTSKVFAALKRIRKDISASANEELIEHAYSQGFFSTTDRTFYLDIWRKRNLSDRQENYKSVLNRKIIQNMAPGTQVQAPVQAVVQRALPDPLASLRNHPTAITDLSLVTRAFTQNCISQKDYDFYSSILQRHVRNPSEKQQKWISDINGKILRNMGGASH